MKRESIGAVHTHTHTHTHGISFIDEKRVEKIYSNFSVEKYFPKLAYVFNLIFSFFYRLLFSKQKDLLFIIFYEEIINGKFVY